MGDTPTTDAPATDAPTTPPVPTPEPPDETLGEPGKKALEAERRQRKELEARLKELEPLADAAKAKAESEKSEITKAAEALAVERDARTKAEGLLLRYEVGTTKGVPATLIKFLVGDTKEAVEEAADALLAELGSKETTGLPGRPQERMVTGKPSNSNLDGLDPMALIAMGRDEQPI